MTRNELIPVITSIRINSGSGFRVCGIAKYLAKAGYRVYVTGIGAPVSDDLGGAGYREIPDGSTLLLVVRSFFTNLFELLKRRTRVIIVSKPLPSSLLPALIVSMLFRSKIILDFDDLEHDYWRNNFLYSKVMYILEKLSVRFSSMITTHSAELSRCLVDKLGARKDKVYMLGQGIDTDIFSRDCSAGSVKKELGLEGKITCVYAAHFNVAAQDFEAILEAFKAASSGSDDLVLLAVGDGPLLKKYKDIAAGMGLSGLVRFTGYVPHSKIPEYFHAADIGINYLSPGAANACRASIKLREYLACGLYTICNDISDDVALFKPYLLTWDSAEPGGLVRCLRSASASMRANRSRNTAGAGYVLKEFGWENIILPFIQKMETL